MWDYLEYHTSVLFCQIGIPGMVPSCSRRRVAKAFVAETLNKRHIWQDLGWYSFLDGRIIGRPFDVVGNSFALWFSAGWRTKAFDIIKSVIFRADSADRSLLNVVVILQSQMMFCSCQNSSRFD